MKPTELYFEPVLIGFATLFITGMMASPALEAWLIDAGDLDKLAVTVAASYFVGIVVDRVADAILDRINHHHRLKFALKQLRRRTSDNERDPFPEDAYHVATLQNQQATEYVYYLRSRIRLMRAMLVLSPAFGVAVALRISRFVDPTSVVDSIWHRGAIGMVCATYVFAVVFRLRETSVVTAPRLRDRRSSHFAPPRTDGLLDSAVLEWYLERIGPEQPLWRFAARNEPLLFAALLLAMFAGVLTGATTGRVIVGLLTAAGVVFIIGVLGWCWWRVTGTFYTFLHNYSCITSHARTDENTDGLGGR
jgi:hypothetical protein